MTNFKKLSAFFSNSKIILIKLFIFAAILNSLFAEDRIKKPPKLLLISLDGLRYDFISPRRTPALWMLSKQGVFLERGVKVQVHTVTASNHYTIVTGLYQESHGIIENEFWDPHFQEWYDVWNFRDNQTSYERSKLSFWYKGTTPIWQTNEEAKYSSGYDDKNRRRSGSYFWPMGDCFINDRTIFRNLTWKDFGNLLIWRKEIDQLIGWFTDEKEPVNFLLYYNAQPDHIEHASDVYGHATGSVIDEVDASIAYLIQRLKETGLLDEVNIILTADHGHANVPDKEHMLDVTDYIDYYKLNVNGRSIFPKPDSGVTPEEIYENLTRAKIEKKLPMQVWMKKDFPIQYHYTNNDRIGPVIVYENLNYMLFLYGNVDNYTRTRHLPISTHGYLNDYAEMRAFFIAHGPAFKKRLLVDGRDDIENIDIYPLMCKILGIDPVPNNGSLDRIKFILRDESDTEKFHSNWENPYVVQFPDLRPNNYLLLAVVLIPIISLSVLGLFCIIDRWHQRGQRANKDSAAVGYRLIRHSSPETHVDMTKMSGEAKGKKLNSANNGTLTAASAGTVDAFGKRINGNKAKFQRSSTNKAISEDGRRQLVRLTDEELSSDENEL